VKEESEEEASCKMNDDRRRRPMMLGRLTVCLSACESALLSTTVSVTPPTHMTDVMPVGPVGRPPNISKYQNR